ncbi:Dolichyl N-acetyl-alpha-D-glucosaminyl phosphate 3-beta-D-2,3-diacetamido-2,3-dideoxy-beta-D-glucuronosyltransferase [uncultured archaeon]|nr:Dolichyl N-acetyl-alpha-D-glucosaminyl phosphate 3-beta-D-2,3-diacetamido-2,3-dideoxy-beta-D-glucuronosyltransferase [uncultured archaeon]
MTPLIPIAVFILIVIPYTIYIGLILKYGNRGSPARKNDYRATVSMIIPTYNEEMLIAKKLDNIFKLDYPPELIEVVIIDSSTDRTPEIIKEYRKRYPCINLIREKRQGLATALNTAYAAAKNEIVIKTDCDSMLEKDVLKKVASDFADPAIGGVTGKQVVINESEVEVGYRSLQSKVQIAESWIDSTIIFHGPFSAYRKSLIAPIDPDSIADDSELAIKVRKQGYRTIIDPGIIFYEASQSAFFKRRMQKDRRGKGLIRLLLQHRDVLFNGKYGSYGRLVFPMNYFMMIISPYMILLLLSLIFYLLFQYSLIISASAAVLLVIFIYLGQANRLYMLEPAYSFLDTQISLLAGGLSLVFGKDSGGTWEVDQELRGAYLKHD